MDTGLTLLKLFDAVYLVALGIWAGSSLFVYTEVAANPESGPPSPNDALRSRALVWGAVCGAVALPALVCGAMGVPEMRGPAIGLKAIVLLIAILLTLYRAASLNRRRPSTREASVRGLSFFSVEAVILCVVLGLLVAHAFRDPPRTRGIEQLDPVARYNAFQAATQGKPTPAPRPVPEPTVEPTKNESEP